MKNTPQNKPSDLEEELRLQLLKQEQAANLSTNLENKVATDSEIAPKSTETASTGSTGTKTDFDTAQKLDRNNLETDSGINLENESKTDSETAPKSTKTASNDSTGTKTDFDIEQKLDRNNLETDLGIDLENEFKTDSETAQKLTETGSTDSTGTKTNQKLDRNNPETDFNFEDNLDSEPIAETQEDPLDDYVQETPKTNPVQELKKATGDSAKNLKNLADLGEIAFSYIDLAKAQLCSSISGQHIAQYTTDEKAKKVLISSVHEFLSTQEIKAPTPLVTLLFAVGTWAAAGFGAAFWHKYQIKQMEEIKPKTEPTPAAVHSEEMVEEVVEQGEPVSDFSHLKEYQDGRKLFAIHKTTGTYKHLPDNTYCAIDIADEFPSPELLDLIEQNKTNPEIRAILYGE
jgi:hypothetical protein